MTNLDCDVVSDISFDITPRDIVIPEAHKELSMLNEPPSLITPDDVKPLIFELIEGYTKKGKLVLVESSKDMKSSKYISARHTNNYNLKDSSLGSLSQMVKNLSQ